MANDTLDGAPNVTGATPAVLDEAHVGDIRGALGTIRLHDTGGPAGLGGQAPDPGRHRGPGDHRDGGRQRRRRGGDLLAGRPKLRHQPAVGAAPADPGADRQPGNGRPAGRGDRRGPCPADQGALRPLLGLVLGRQPSGPRFPHHRHRVHRRGPGPRLLRRQQVRLRPRRRLRSGGHHGLGQLPALGTFHAPLRRGELPGRPAGRVQPSPRRPGVHGLFVPGISGGANSTSVLLIIAIVGTTVAPWQLFFQQSNIVDKRITPRYINYERVDTVLGSFVTVVGASCLMVVTCAFAFSHTTYFHHFTDAGGVARDLGRRWATPPARSTPWCCSTPPSSGPRP